MAASPLVAHSLAEVYLYLMVTPCCACGKGPLTGSDAHSMEGTAPPAGQSQGSLQLATQVTCGACARTEELVFQMPHGLGTDEAVSAVVNPTPERSVLIDLAQWLTLFRMITEAAANESNKTAARGLGLEAAQCLDEALKFYDDPDNELPPPEAFFHDSSRQRFAQAPQQFSRQRLIDLRAKLPKTSVMRQQLQQGEKRRRWWKRSS